MPKTNLQEEETIQLIREIVAVLRKHFIDNNVKCATMFNLVFETVPFFNLKAEAEIGSGRVVVHCSNSLLGWLSILSEEDEGLDIVYKSELAVPIKEDTYKEMIQTKVHIDVYTLVSKAIINDVKLDLCPLDPHLKTSLKW